MTRLISSISYCLSIIIFLSVLILTLCHQKTLATATATTATSSKVVTEEQQQEQQEDHDVTSMASIKNNDKNDKYLIGTGIYDITGPAAQINFMGYAKTTQTAHGIHQRLRSRAFIISEKTKQTNKISKENTFINNENEKETEQTVEVEEKERLLLRRKEKQQQQNNDNNDIVDDIDDVIDPNKTICFVSIDIGMGSDIINKLVLEKLNELKQKPGKNKEQSKKNNKNIPCHLENLSISGTHTHSAPGGFIQYTLYQITSLGYSKETLDIYVNGIVQSLIKAYDNLLNMADDNDTKSYGTITSIEGYMPSSKQSNINRSPSSYLLNPIDERNLYINEGNDVDTKMTILQFTATSTTSDDSDDEKDQENEITDIDIGMINWFSVHGTSMNGTNTLISGDNKGYASYLMEKDYNSNSIGRNNTNTNNNNTQNTYTYVAAFASTNLGDVSPNTNGPKCTNTGLPCDILTSTCKSNSNSIIENNEEKDDYGNVSIGGGNDDDGNVGGILGGGGGVCIASGPGRNMYESTQIIGYNQYEFAKYMMTTTTTTDSNNMNDEDDTYTTNTAATTNDYIDSRIKKTKINGHINYRHSFIDMSKKNVTLANGTIVKTCPAALGYSFAAGTTDGPGELNFKQGTNTSNKFWNIISGFLSIPSKEQIQCQYPKPILLNTGEASLPYKWDPASIPISIFQIGSFYILNVPSELTTMAGRRLRNAIRNVLINEKYDDNPIIVIAGLANSYTHYVTTYEEYVGQRYEAASTLYGPYTLDAYIQEFKRITLDMIHDRISSSDDNGPPDLSKKQIQLLPPVVLDTIGIGKKFGSVVIDAKEQYDINTTTMTTTSSSSTSNNNDNNRFLMINDNITNNEVYVSFRSANPRNNPRIEDTFLTIDRLNDNDGTWETLYDDGDWCTKYYWYGNIYLGTSYADIIWTIPYNTKQGLYRICHYGTRKTLIGEISNIMYHMPDWITNNIFSSMAINTIYNTIRFISSFIPGTKSWLIINSSSSSSKIHKYKNFTGCSRTFLVKKQKQEQK